MATVPTDTAPALSDLEIVISNVLGIIARLVGIVVFIMLIVGGYTFLTASGDPKKAEQAQKIITGAIAAIVVIVIGWLLILLLENITGAELTTFQIQFQ